MTEIGTLLGQNFPDKDIKVLIGKWQWSEESPWPPIGNITSTPFWKSDLYNATREKLKRPLPSLEYAVSGDFITLTYAKSGTTRELGVSDEPQEEVCYLAFPNMC